jgi:hypothetical protein
VVVSQSKPLVSFISGFRRHVDEIYALLGCYAASSGNTLPTFRDHISVLSSRVKKKKSKDFVTLEDGTDMLSQNVSKELPHDAASHPRRAQI